MVCCNILCYERETVVIIKLMKLPGSEGRSHLVDVYKDGPNAALRLRACFSWHHRGNELNSDQLLTQLLKFRVSYAICLLEFFNGDFRRTLFLLPIFIE